MSEVFIISKKISSKGSFTLAGIFNRPSLRIDLSSVLEEYDGYKKEDFLIVPLSMSFSCHFDHGDVSRNFSAGCSPKITEYNPTNGVLSVSGLTGSQGDNAGTLSGSVSKLAVYIIPHD